MGRLLGRLGGQQRAGSPVFPVPPIPPVYGGDPYGRAGTSSAATLRPDEAMRVSAVWACVALVSNAVAMLPLETYRASNGGVPNRIEDPPLVVSPAAGVAQVEWVQQVMTSLLLRGNAYGHIVTRDSLARPTQVELWHPDAVTLTLTDTGTVVYDVGAAGGQRVRIPTPDVWHVRGLTMPGAKVGLSPIAYAAEQIGLDAAARRFAADFFGAGGAPTGVLESDQMLTQEQAQTLKERFLAAATGRTPAVLGAGTTWKPMSVTPEESQFLATQQANVAQIARYFSVPASMIGGSMGDSMTYANVEQRNLDFLTYGLQPWLRRLEAAISALLPRGQFVSFKTSELLRTDAHTQAQVEILQIASKTRVPSEVRADHGWAPFTLEEKIEADLVPLTVSPLGRPAATSGAHGLDAPDGTLLPPALLEHPPTPDPAPAPLPAVPQLPKLPTQKGAPHA